MRYFLGTLKVNELRAMAVDMRYRWESRRDEIIDFLVKYVPSKVAEEMTQRNTR